MKNGSLGLALCAAGVVLCSAVLGCPESEPGVALDVLGRAPPPDTAKMDSDTDSDTGTEPSDVATEVGAPVDSIVTPDDGPSIDNPPDQGPPPPLGDIGDPCDGDDDCESGLCAHGEDGAGFCSKPCLDGCPTGWDCAPGDGLWFCVEGIATTCEACNGPDDCAHPAHVCGVVAEEGRFCLRACDPDQAPCPAGSDCVDVDADGALACVPTTDSCGCTEETIGSQEPCTVENTFGTCAGLRTCSGAGWSACDAATAAAETCDEADNDCDGDVDEAGADGCTDYFADQDDDGFGEANSAPTCLCAPTPPYTATEAGDCADLSPLIKPGALEVCNGEDDDCDGLPDQGLGGGPCTSADGCLGTIVCGGAEGGLSCTAPAATPEACDLVDNDCNGTVDDAGAEGCIDRYLDVDEDGFGVGEPSCLCGPVGKLTALKPGDCNDNNPNVHPDAAEICNEGVDDDCKDGADPDGAPGCLERYLDEDDDGFGLADSEAKCLCSPAAPWTALEAGDCDDKATAVNPDAVEICNGIDDNCVDEVDEGLGGGPCSGSDGECEGTLQCQGAAGLVCDAPDATTETCDGKDNDCDGNVDEEDATGCTTYYEDVDDDGAGKPFSGKCLCDSVDHHTATVGGDCNDDKDTIKPGVEEICNDGVDDNCDDIADPVDSTGCSLLFEDADDDQWGVAGSEMCLCAAVGDHTAIKPGDCNDKLPGVFPGATEACNGLDDNCNEQVDEGLGGAACSIANEHGECAGSEVCNGEAGIACNAQVPAAELCDEADNDCDEAVDEADAGGCTVFYADKDEDGVGSAVSLCLCAPEGEYTSEVTGDCNDLSAFISPKYSEVCNGIDDNCDDIIDIEDSAGCDLHYRDDDIDGWGVAGDSRCLCAAEKPYAALKAGDCNDDSNQVFPGAVEVCNGKDENCNSTPDDGIDETAPCASNNAIGSCTGSIVCAGVEGMKCNAPAAVVEVCDGLDEDCDGTADNGTSGTPCSNTNEFGTCAGVEVCNGADGLSCTAAVPSTEVCDGVDNDCSGSADTEEDLLGCETYYVDFDEDGFGSEDFGLCLCGPQYPLTTQVAEDCNDSNFDIKPGVPDLCDGSDNDCDGEYEEDTATAPCTNDNEFGSCPGTSICLGGAGVYCDGPTPAAETCDGLDNDCDNATDEEVGGGPCTTTNAIGTCQGNLICTDGGGLLCNAPEAAPEACDGADTDCDGTVDEEDAVGCVPHFIDGDGDGVGAGESRCLCAPDGAHVATAGNDCNDNNKAIFPGATEYCNAVDDNCQDGIDEPGAELCTDYHWDEDGDGFGLDEAILCLCNPLGEFDALQGGDCDDTKLDVFPGAPEKCDGLLQACGLEIDTGCDDDLDDFCDHGLVLIGVPDVCPLGGGDCNDKNPAIHPLVVEVCDTVDNNCDGQIDEGVGSPCGVCGATVCDLSAGPGGDHGFDSPGDGLAYDDDGNVVLNVDATDLSMLWVANSGNGTVSKLNTETGDEVGRYIVGANPSRTAVDFRGNCWVANRGDGHVVQIILDPQECFDKNGDGIITSSADLNGNGTIEPTEMLSKEEDECVAQDLTPDAAYGGKHTARALAIDYKDDIWVGYWESRRMYLISASTGAVVKTVQLGTSGRPYGAAMDGDGRLFVSMRYNKSASWVAIMETDPVVGPPKYVKVPGDSYGIAVDANGMVWVAGGSTQRVFWFDPGAPIPTPATIQLNQGNTRGVAATLEGDVYVAEHQWTCKGSARYLARIDADTKQLLSHVDLGGKRGPIGVTVGFGGTIWSLNQCTSTATKLDAVTGEILGEFPTGPAPYTYSDMTGYMLRAMVKPSGEFYQIYEGWETGTTTWASLDAVVLTPPESAIEVSARAADSLAALETAPWVDFIGAYPFQPLPFDLKAHGLVGRYLQVLVRMSSKVPNSSPVLQKLIVTAEHTP